MLNISQRDAIGAWKDYGILIEEARCKWNAWNYETNWRNVITKFRRKVKDEVRQGHHYGFKIVYMKYMKFVIFIYIKCWITKRKSLSNKTTDKVQVFFFWCLRWKASIGLAWKFLVRTSKTWELLQAFCLTNHSLT